MIVPDIGMWCEFVCTSGLTFREEWAE